MSYTSLPRQKLTLAEKTQKWKEACIDYYEKLSFTSSNGNRTSNQRKIINYNLFNAKFDPKDLEYVSNPLGLKDVEFPATLQHYDIISPSLMLLFGEEIKRPDNHRVIAEGPEVITRKEKAITEQIKTSLIQQVMAEIDPSTIDPNNPPQPPEEILKYAKHSHSDLIESMANKCLSYLKRSLSTKNIFNKGWKDVLIAGEEIYWVGIINGEPTMRRCNPPDISVVLDGDSDFIDDAIAVVETRILSISSILDEFGDVLTSKEISTLEEEANGLSSSHNSPGGTINFVVPNGDGSVPTGLGSYNNAQGVSNYQQGFLKVVRVEWQSMKKVGTFIYIDKETGEIQEIMVDETFKLDPEERDYLISMGIEKPLEWWWINEAWEGDKIGNEIYKNIQPKYNQRKRLDNPYYCRLGYSGLIYNAINSMSTSLVDRMKPYQYLYNIISYRLELAFASDMGKIMLMDLAQIPKSEGISMEQWMYYLKAMKIAFINSNEEGKKGTRIGQISNFNQFQSIDMSLSNTIQQYINTLEFIKNQIAFLSGISPQRLGSISASELVGNTQASIQQSSNVTEYWFDSHNEVKKRVYTALVECAKIAWRKGKKVQYVLDDMSIEMLTINGEDFENAEYSAFISNSAKDVQVVETLKQLFQSGLQSDKVTLSEIAKVLATDSASDITKLLEVADDKRAQQMQAQQEQQSQIQEQQMQVQQQMHQEELADKEADRALKQYEIDSNNQTKIQVAEINVYSRQDELDQDNDGIPDPIELGTLAMKQQDISSKAFMEQSKLANDRDKHSKEMNIKEREIKAKQEIENKKIEAIKVQNISQEKMQREQIKLKEKEMKNKIEVEKLKIKAKPKPTKK